MFSPLFSVLYLQKRFIDVFQCVALLLIVSLREEIEVYTNLKSLKYLVFSKTIEFKIA